MTVGRAALGLSSVAAGMLVTLFGLAPAALAAPGTEQGAEGQSLSVSQVDGLDPAGQQVTVTGKGYDEEKGIYVAYCVVPAPGQPPSPCGGGVDTSGVSGASQWVSSNPPEYGKTLAEPYAAGGSFSVTLTVSGTIGEDVDCTVTECAVVTRADHTRTGDRTQDVFVPVSFASPVAAEPSGDPRAYASKLEITYDKDEPGVSPWFAAGGGVAAAGAIGTVLVLSRRARREKPDA